MNGWREFFADITYKPGFTFDYELKSDFAWETVTLTMRVPDSRDLENLKSPEEMQVGWGREARRFRLLPITMTDRLPPWICEQAAKEYLRFLIRKMEMHEIDEWLRFQGKLINDPHADQEAYDHAG